LPTETQASAPPTAPLRILVLDGDETLRQALSVMLKQEGRQPSAVGSLEAALTELAQRDYELVLADAAGEEGLDAIEALAEAAGEVLVLAMLPIGDARAWEARRRGAYDCIPRPLRGEELTLAIDKAEERQRLMRDNQRLRDLLAAREPPGASADASLIGDSAVMRELDKMLRKIAEHKTTVLISGESGTGKELAARAIHAASPRRNGPFVAVNCGAIPESLLESELFGHKRGAFTDAVRDKLGLFSEANGGTLFLDEIGEMPLQPQVRLLRVLQEQKVRPVGGTEDEAVDVRVVAATMRDLAADVSAGRFREDLFYRLNVIQVALPALRDRREDLRALIDHFLARANKKLGTCVRAISPEAVRLLSTYSWPGNVRELENTIERSVVLCEGDTLTAAGLPERLHTQHDPVREVLQSGELSIKKTIRVVEETLIRRALVATAGNRTNAAKKLEISHRALLYKIKEYRVLENVGRVVPGGTGTPLAKPMTK
jgi:two-component system, NtrC family, response regulator AtoC